MFPRISRTRKWYYSTKDGLMQLKYAIHSSTFKDISEMTGDEVFGMTEKEWGRYLDARLEEHELYASLALLVSCEGAIRRDMAWRISKKKTYHLAFRKVPSDRYVKLSTIISRWWSELGPRANHVDKHLKRLADLYIGRNALAHGRAGVGAFVFEALWGNLERIEQKWKQVVSDFQGF